MVVYSDIDTYNMGVHMMIYGIPNMKLNSSIYNDRTQFVIKDSKKI